MAHNIEINNGVASYAENGRKERAWHGLGQVFDRPMTVKEALEASHADYRVELQPLVAMTPTLAEHLADDNYAMTYFADEVLDCILPDRKVTMRMDTMKPLGVVSDTYGVVQNEDAFKFIDTLCTGGTGTPVIESAGVLGRGERVFITAKFSDQIILDNKGNDRVEMYVVFTTSHDGSSAVNCLVTPVRVVCNNTLNLAMWKNAGKLSLKHTSGIMTRLDLARQENAEFAFKTLGMYDVYKKSLEECFKRLQNIRLAEKDLDRILAEVLLSEASYDTYKKTGSIDHDEMPKKGQKLVHEVREYIESGVGQEYGEKGTALWAVNGLTSYYQNSVTYKNEEKKFNSIQAGRAQAKVQQAFELALRLA